MNTNETEIIDGYTVTIATDDYAENPFTNNDCEVPLLTYYDGRHGNFKSYGDAPETLGQIIDLIPWSIMEHEQAYPGKALDGIRHLSPDPSPFERGRRVQTIREYLDCGLKELAETRKYSNSDGTVRDAFRYEVEQKIGDKPEGWRYACAWFETAVSLLNEAGITCIYERSTGHCQGDVTLCLAIATPDWINLTGCSPENAKAACQSTIDLYSAWAWGDVYGVESITDPDGNEVEDVPSWSFYGRDHEESGLLDHAREYIESHKQEQLDAALHEPACLI